MCHVLVSCRRWGGHRWWLLRLTTVMRELIVSILRMANVLVMLVWLRGILLLEQVVDHGWWSTAVGGSVIDIWLDVASIAMLLLAVVLMWLSLLLLLIHPVLLWVEAVDCTRIIYRRSLMWCILLLLFAQCFVRGSSTVVEVGRFLQITHRDQVLIWFDGLVLWSDRLSFTTSSAWTIKTRFRSYQLGRLIGRIRATMDLGVISICCCCHLIGSPSNICCTTLFALCE